MYSACESHVKIVYLNETITAYRTQVRFVSRVPPDVQRQIIGLREGPVAKSAFVRALTCVDSHVPDELVRSGESWMEDVNVNLLSTTKIYNEDQYLCRRLCTNMVFHRCASFGGIGGRKIEENLDNSLVWNIRSEECIGFRLPFPQMSHLYGFSPVCLRMWTIRLDEFENDLPQYTHKQLESISSLGSWILECDLKNANNCIDG